LSGPWGLFCLVFVPRDRVGTASLWSVTLMGSPAIPHAFMHSGNCRWLPAHENQERDHEPTQPMSREPHGSWL
jgi:hypothetical protein